MNTIAEGHIGKTIHRLKLRLLFSQETVRRQINRKELVEERMVEQKEYIIYHHISTDTSQLKKQ